MYQVYWTGIRKAKYLRRLEVRGQEALRPSIEDNMHNLSSDQVQGIVERNQDLPLGKPDGQ